MMDCAIYRRAMMVDPHDADPALTAHREGCHDCSVYSERLLRFESRLDQALRVATPSSMTDRVPRSLANRLGMPGSRQGWLALAASVLMAAVVAGGLWLSVPASSLAADVVTHMRGEPNAWRRTEESVPSAALQNVLRDSGLRLAAGADRVTYASSCGFRGHHVPHLVVQTESGPVTVMVLVHEQVLKSTQFDEQGYRGVIVPVAGHGSIAVLTRGAAADPASIQHIAARVLDSIVWTG